MNSVQRIAALRLFALATAILGTVVVAGTMVRLAGNELVVNGSPSVPRGLYWIRLGAMPSAKGDYVLFRPPGPFAALIYGRGWLPVGMPLLKPVGGLEGDRYCVEGGRFIVNGVDVGPVFISDSHGLAVPQFVGCRRVKRDEFLPVSSFLARSFDGRYMGAVAMGRMIGTGIPVWTY